MDAALRSSVIERAGSRCEYCHLRQEHQPVVAFHVEHIVPRQHGGGDSPENLCLACHRCNLHKGPNLTGLDPDSGAVTRLFHPRRDRWEEHFALHDGRIVGLTAVGRTTVELLQMNVPERVETRLELIAAGLWE
ncbi:MAG: HNH endonuclease [Verrucomicrobia bacterium]|nr:HNH endonuclease [Verrucomicrobiota bacterium]